MAALIPLTWLLIAIGIVGKHVLQVQYFDHVRGPGQGLPYFYGWRRGMQPWEERLAEWRGYRQWLRESGKARLNKLLTGLMVVGVAGFLGFGFLSR